MSAVQTAELSGLRPGREGRVPTTVRWYTGCRDQRVQLLSSLRLTGTGDEARLLVLRSWEAPVTTYTVGLRADRQHRHLRRTHGALEGEPPPWLP